MSNETVSPSRTEKIVDWFFSEGASGYMKLADHFEWEPNRVLMQVQTLVKEGFLKEVLIVEDDQTQSVWDLN